jgi:hypothetical protein
MTRKVSHITSLLHHRISLRRAILLMVPTLFYASIAHAQSGTGGLVNPLKFNDISSFIAGSLKVLVIVAIPIITLFIVISGFMFVAARGNEKKLEDAKKNFLFVIIGSLLILGAWVLATLLGATVSQLVRNL